MLYILTSCAALFVSYIIWPSKIQQNGLSWGLCTTSLLAFPITLTNVGHALIGNGFSTNNIAAFAIQIIFALIVGMAIGYAAFYTHTAYNKLRRINIKPISLNNEPLKNNSTTSIQKNNLEVNIEDAKPITKQSTINPGYEFYNNYEFQNAIDSLLENALNGDSEAQLYVGLSFMELEAKKGEMHKQMKSALNWIRESAQHGNSTAQYVYGTMHEDGWGAYLKADLAEAKAWYQLSANQGNPDAAYKIKKIKEQNDNSKTKSDIELELKRVGVKKYLLNITNKGEETKIVEITDARYKHPHEWSRPNSILSIVGHSFSIEPIENSQIEFEFNYEDQVHECNGDQIEISYKLGSNGYIVKFENASSVKPEFIPI